MKAQDLKNSILQLAIQGKLVPQDPNDEPADVLYDKIQSEKQRLIKEGKIKKDKPLPPITDDEIPFKIPQFWKWVRLGDIVKIYTGSKDANYGSENGIYPFFTCAAEPIKCDYYSFDGESLLLPGNGANVGLCIYYDGKFEAYQRTYVLQGFIPYLKYLHHLLNFRWKKYNEDKMYGSAMPYIKLANIQNFPVPLPPLAEQKRIVAKIEELEPLVKQYDKAETELSNLNESFPEQLKKSILQYAIQGKLVPQDPNDEPADVLYDKIQFEKQRLIKEGKIKKDKPLPPITDDEIPFPIPSTWKWVRLGDCLDVRDGTHDTPKYVSVGIPLVTSKNLYNGFLDLSNVKYISTKDAEKINERSKVHKNDILFAMIGTIGNPVIVDIIPNFCIKNMALIKNNDFVDIKYVAHFLAHIQNDMKKQAQGAVQSFVSLSFIRNFPIPLPPLAEQKRIVAKVDELIRYCEKLIRVKNN